MPHRNLQMKCPACQLSMRLKTAKDDFGHLVIEYECVLCLESCDVITENWTNQVVQQAEIKRMDIN